MLFSGSKEHGRTRNRRTNVQCVWMIWSGTTGWALKSDSWEDMGFKERFLAWMGLGWVVQGVVLALQSASLSEDVLLLCNNTAVLCAIKKWVGQGGKTTLAIAPDADIPTRNSLPANATCASRKSYFPA
jgi:hypothetical protein